jgi:copper chaperone CopZ
MRFILLLLFLLAEIVPACAQVKHATLQAAGLTCAMCSNAIYQSLSSLSFIEEVSPDVANSSFQIKFKADKNIDPDQMRAAVEEAGFSIAELRITIGNRLSLIPSDKIVNIQGLKLFVVNESGLSFDKDVTFLFLDKGYLTEKMLKEYAKKTGINLKKNKNQVAPGMFTVMISEEVL